MRNNIRYAFLGLVWWGCDASPDSQSAHPDSTSTSALASVGDGSEESDPNRRGCGEGEEDTGFVEFDPTGFDENIVWDTGVFDTGEVYYVD